MTTTLTTSYTVRRYNDASSIGSVDLTADQFRRYELAAGTPEGVLLLRELADIVDIDLDSFDCTVETSIYIE